jgi:hypothetical protein
MRMQVLTRVKKKDPDFAANVGQALDQLREDHEHIPFVVPGLDVSEPTVRMELAQIPGISFQGEEQYTRFWKFFRALVNSFSVRAHSEVVTIYQIGPKFRIRWRLVLTPRVTPPAVAAAAAAAAAAALVATGDSADLLEINSAVTPAVAAAAAAAATLPKDGAYEARTVDFNSIYELDCWNGRIIAHTLEFRTPQEESPLLQSMQLSLNFGAGATPGTAQLMLRSGEREPDRPDTKSEDLRILTS